LRVASQCSDEEVIAVILRRGHVCYETVVLRRAPIIAVFAAIAAGVALADGLSLPATGLGLAIPVVLVVLAVAHRRRTGAALVALLALALCGALAAAWHRAPPIDPPACGEEPAPTRVRVASAVERRVQRDRELGQAFTGELVSVECGARRLPLRGRVLVTLWGEPALARGDLVQARLRILPLPVARNPTDVDGSELGRRRGVSGRAVTSSPHAIVAHGRGLLAALDRWRQAAAERFEQALPAERAAVAKAIALGDDAGIEREQRDAWARAGTAHIVAISGLHLAFIAGLVLLLLRGVLAWLPGAAERFSVRRVAALGTVPVVILYCLATGAPPSAVRSTIMAVAFLVGLAVHRPSSGANALGLAGAGILLCDPTSLYDVGFLLSFAAVAALLLAPRLPPATTIAARLRRYLLVTVVTSFAASAATAPITAYVFGQVSIVAPLSNLVAVPLGAGVVTPLALAFALFGPVVPALEPVLAAPLSLGIGALDAIARSCDRSGLAAVDLPRPSLLELVAYAVLLVAVVALVRRRRVRWLIVAAGVVLAIAVGQRLVAGRGDGTLTLVHPYVGQGESTLAFLPDGGVVVYDAGGSAEGTWDPGRAVLAPLLRRRGVRRIDLAVISHNHPDHVGGMVYLAEHFPVTELWWNGVAAEEPAFARARAAVVAAGGTVHTAGEVPRRSTREGVVFERLGPSAAALAGSDLNDTSIVLRLVHGRASFLLSGDIGERAEAEMAAVLTPTDGLKVPHHGSRGSSSDAFVTALAPRLAVISAGEANHYGVPHPEVLQRYAAAGARVLRTDLDGAVEMSSDGVRWRVRTFLGGEIEPLL
jgi:competence protein ComEC